MGIIFGLAAALGFGAADFLARYATQRVGTYRALLFMQFFGLTALTVFVLASGDLRHYIAVTTWQPWAYAVVGAILGTACSLALYRAFETGVLSIVSPIAASFAGVSVILSALSGEVLTTGHAVGIAATMLGVILTAHAAAPGQVPIVDASGARRSWLPPGVALALTAAVGFGVLFWIFGFHVTPALGSIVPVWLTRLVTPALLLLVARPLRQSIAVPAGRVWWLIGAVGVLDTAGFLAITSGLQSAEVAVVSVVGSLFSAVTVLLAWLFLREQLHRIQWLGILFILAGVALVSA